MHTTGGQLFVIVRPLQSAHFTLVAHELAREVGRCAHIALEDVAVPTAGGQRVRAPRQRAHTRSMPAHRADLSTPNGIPDLKHQPSHNKRTSTT